MKTFIVFHKEGSTFATIEAKNKQEAIEKYVFYLNRGESFRYYKNEFKAIEVTYNPAIRGNIFCSLNKCVKAGWICCSICSEENCGDRCTKNEEECSFRIPLGEPLIR